MSGGPVRIDPAGAPARGGAVPRLRVQVFAGWLYDRRGWPSALPVWVGRCWFGEAHRLVGVYGRVGNRMGGIIFGVPRLAPRQARKPPEPDNHSKRPEDAISGPRPTRRGGYPRMGLRGRETPTSARSAPPSPDSPPNR